MKERTEQDEIIKGKIATALKLAMKKRSESPEDAARLLQVELGTLYKYLAGDMIPGGQVLWRACQHLGMVLDEKGLRVTRRQTAPAAKSRAARSLNFLSLTSLSTATKFAFRFVEKTISTSSAYVLKRPASSRSP